MEKYVITGVGESCSLGSMICEAIRNIDTEAHITAICEPGNAAGGAVNAFYCIDLSKTSDILDWAIEFQSENPDVDCLINCAAINMMEWFENIKPNDLMHVFNINFFAPIFLIQSLLPVLSNNKGTVLNIMSEASHKPLRTSLAYNTTKAALAMANRQLAKELTDKFDVTIFGISPNELEGTGLTVSNDEKIFDMRGWTEESYRKIRESGSIYKERTDPHELAEFIAYLLFKKERHIHLSGSDIQYGD